MTGPWDDDDGCTPATTEEVREWAQRSYDGGFRAPWIHRMLLRVEEDESRFRDLKAAAIRLLDGVKNATGTDGLIPRGAVEHLVVDLQAVLAIGPHPKTRPWWKP